MKPNHLKQPANLKKCWWNLKNCLLSCWRDCVRWYVLKAFALITIPLSYRTLRCKLIPSEKNRLEWQGGIYPSSYKATNAEEMEEEYKYFKDNNLSDDNNLKAISEEDASNIGLNVEKHQIEASSLISQLSVLVVSIGLPLILIGLLTNSAILQNVVWKQKFAFFFTLFYGSAVLIVVFLCGVFYHFGYIRENKMNPHRTYRSRRKNKTALIEVIRQKEGIEIFFGYAATEENKKERKKEAFFLKRDDFIDSVEKLDKEEWWLVEGLLRFQNGAFKQGILSIAVSLGFFIYFVLKVIL